MTEPKRKFLQVISNFCITIQFHPPGQLIPLTFGRFVHLPHHSSLLIEKKQAGIMENVAFQPPNRIC